MAETARVPPSRGGAGRGSATAVEALIARAAASPDAVAFRFQDLGIWNEVTWAEASRRVARLAGVMRDLGVQEGDRVGFLTDPSPDWFCLDLATQAVGAVPFATYASASHAEVRDLLERGRAAVVVAQGHEELERVLGAAEDVDGIRQVVVTDPRGLSDTSHPAVVVTPLADLERRTVDGSDSLVETATLAGPDSPAALVFTAGAAEFPCPVEWTGRALVGAVERWVEGTFTARGLPAPGPRDRVVAELPVAHVVGRLVLGVLPVTHGVVPHFPEHVGAVPRAIHAVGPTISVAPARAWRAGAGNLETAIASCGRFRRSLLRATEWARRSALGLGGRSSTPARVLAPLLDALVGRPARRKLGVHAMRVSQVVDAGLSDEIADAWRAWDVELVETYGTAELGLVAAATNGAATRPRTMRLFDGVEARVSDTGELEVRVADGAAGRGSSGETEDASAWRATGDLGTVERDEIGIVGPLDGLLSLPGGRTQHAAVVERILASSPSVLGAVVTVKGTGLTAILEPALDILRDRAPESMSTATSAEELLATPEVRAILQADLDVANEHLAAAGLAPVREVTVLPRALDPLAGDPVTPTRKVKRRDIDVLAGEGMALLLERSGASARGRVETGSSGSRPAAATATEVS